ncbi:MAG TPA: hypothetical protein VNZ49_01150 [Bacteroidia bacterium]|jgi:hypothetical protein|nr:hypothetical protein [Bacteroidia bacterium]
MALMVLISLLISCGPDNTQKAIASKADSLLISVGCVKTVTQLITTNFLLPGQKKTQYKMEYIKETWPDTITKVQANRLLALENLGRGYEKLVSISSGLQVQSIQQLEQLKKLNDEINSGASGNENLVQYLTFESKCADTLNRVLDTLVKKSIELSCKNQSL